MGFFSFVRLLYGTGWLGPHQQYGAEGAALGSQSEPSTSYHIPVYIATEFFIFVSLPTTTGGGGRVGGRVGGGCEGLCCGPTPEPYYTTKLCTTGMLFTPKAFQGSEKSTVDLSFSLSYFSKEVEVRDKFPAHFLSPSVSPSVITGCVRHCRCCSFSPRGNLLHSS